MNSSKNNTGTSLNSTLCTFKKLKKITLLFILIINFISCKTNEKTETNKNTNKNKNKKTYLSFTIKNYERNTISLKKVSDLAKLKLNKDLKLKADNYGTYQIELTQNEPEYYRIARNYIYISPGDSIVAIFDVNDPENTTYKGRGFEPSKYLNSIPYPKAGSYLWSGREIKKSLPETIENINLIAKKRKEELKNTKKLSKEFIVLEEARLKADLINSYYSLHSYFGYVNKIPQDQNKELSLKINEATEEEIKKLTKDFIDTNFLKIVSYQQISSLILKNNNKNTPEKQKLQDWMKSNYLFYNIVQSKSKEEITKKFEENIDSIKTPRYKDRLQKIYLDYTSYGNGSIATNFKSSNFEGKKKELKEYKGKVIYIDLWATWCTPCLKEMPHFNELAEKYSKNKDIVFISLSIDDHLEDWKSNLNNRTTKGLQWNTSRINLDKYKINGVPRIIIIDKDFKIVNYNAPEPSNKKTISIIDSLISKK